MPGTLSVVPKTTAASVRLLLVTRESAILSLLWPIGEARKWHLESATNGWGAMERVQSGVTPDLLILDLNMPEPDGFDLLKIERSEFPYLRILVISGYLKGPLLTAAKFVGAFATLEKPFAPNVLVDKVREVLGELTPAAAR